MDRTDIRIAWPAIRDRVAEILSHGDDGCTPEEVYAFCRFNKADLWMDDKGFCVTQLVENQHNLDRELYVWLAHMPHRAKELQSFVEELARRHNCVCVAFQCFREGVEVFTPAEYGVRSVMFKRRI